MENVLNMFAGVAADRLVQAAERLFGDWFSRDSRETEAGEESGISRRIINELCVPESPDSQFGLKSAVTELKNRFLHKDAGGLLAVTGMGGSGKTTLAIALCEDADVKDHFKERIFFVKVTQSPYLLGRLKIMWDKIVGMDRPDFDNVEVARQQLQRAIRLMELPPTLVVLDDVWKIDDLEKLSFEGKGYKTLITTRNKDVVKHLKPDCRYEKELLKEPDDETLFCLSAFNEKFIPDTVRDHDLVKEIIKECGGLPLALQVIGKSLRGQHDIVWVNTKDKLSQGQTACDDHEEKLFKCLGTSLDVLKPEVRECFLDMVIFSGGRRISVAPLLDLGVYVHKLRWTDAYSILIELASRNLVKLVNNQKYTLGDSYGSSDELSFIQHDVLRDLAIYRTEQEPKPRCKRLFMPQKADFHANNWNDDAINAKIVSLDTGLMEEKDWCQMEFPEAEALILNFSASEYFLPPFMKSMRKLKVLIIVNHNSRRAKLEGISVFRWLTQLKVFRLERVIVPAALQKHCHSWQELEKLSFILCEDFGNMGFCKHFPKLHEITIDHSINLAELPASICNMNSLERLSVTNCHGLRRLSDAVGNLSSLQMLRLHACPSLEELPSSICKLKNLKFLDISLCGCIKQLPDELSQLSALKEIDMRECSRVKVPESARGLSSLRHVICDEKIGHQWSKIKASNIPRLRVEVAEEYFTLVWLDD